MSAAAIMAKVNKLLFIREPLLLVLGYHGLPELREGQTVEFEIEPAKDGKTAATNLKLR